MSNGRIEEAARLLRDARTTGQPCSPVREILPDGDVAAAYAAQEINTELDLKAGRRLIGRKIGLTSVAVQKQLGVDQPDYGMLYADMEVLDGDEVSATALIQPKVEAEVAFVMADDLSGPAPTMVELMNAIAYALPAIEIVDSRVRNWDIKISDTIADNASSGLYVLGTTPTLIEELDLRLCGMVLEKNGEPTSFGAGAACLGNPLKAALWVARKMIEVGRPLQAGDILLSGALGPMVGIEPAGARIEARISGLGSVRVAFAPKSV